MYVLLVYDIEVMRLTKVHKFLKCHLHWVQNSVFEGELTDAQLEAVRVGLRRLVSDDADSVLIYTAREQKWLTRETLGKERSEIDNLL